MVGCCYWVSGFMWMRTAPSAAERGAARGASSNRSGSAIAAPQGNAKASPAQVGRCSTSHQTCLPVGDFNGDLSQDLAVILKPAEGRLSELNQEFPNWIAREPLQEVLPKSKLLARPAAERPSPNSAAGQTIRFHQSDVLLAIVHGYGPKGWQDPEATQTHLLRDVVGANIRTLPFKGAVKAYKGIKPFPTIHGDLIQETLIGQSGFLHFTGGIYGWYDPKNYKPDASMMPAHSPVAAMR